VVVASLSYQGNPSLVVSYQASQNVAVPGVGGLVR
jgi:hypothetical protein